MRIFFIFILSFFWKGCLGIPKGVDPVSDFDLDRYLGK